MNRQFDKGTLLLYSACYMLIGMLWYYSSYIPSTLRVTNVNSLITISLQYSACYTPMSLSSNRAYYFFGWESLSFHKLQFMLHVLKLNTFSPFCYYISYGFFFFGDRRVSCPQFMLHILSSNLYSNTLLSCVLFFVHEKSLLQYTTVHVTSYWGLYKPPESPVPSLSE
jgi:hypothetical protein